MALTASQLDQLHSALLTAVTQEELRQFLRVRLNVNFGDIPAEQGYRNQVWRLVTWANRQGWAVELVLAAAEEKPANMDLQVLRAAVQPWATTQAPTHEPFASPDKKQFTLEQREILEEYTRTLSGQRQAGEKVGEAGTLLSIGRVYVAMGDQRQALDYFEQALLAQRQVGDMYGGGFTLNDLGRLCAAMGDLPQAMEHFEEAQEIFELVGERWGETAVRYNIALAARSLGDLERAEAELQRVVEIDEAEGFPGREGNLAKLDEVRRERQGR